MLDKFKNDQALDVLADIIEPANEIMTDPQIGELRENKATRMEVALYVIREHKPSIWKIYETLTGEKKEEATIPKLLKVVMDLFSDEELTSLF